MSKIDSMMLTSPMYILMKNVHDKKFKDVLEKDLHQLVSDERWEGIRVDRSDIRPFSEDIDNAVFNLMLCHLCYSTWEYLKGSTFHFDLKKIKRTLKIWEKQGNEKRKISAT